MSPNALEGDPEHQWPACEVAVRHAQAGAFLARPADEGVAVAYVEEAERSEERRWQACRGESILRPATTAPVA